MAFGSIEFTTISRLQDYSGIKQNEDNKGMIDQGHIVDHVQKTTEQRSQEVQATNTPATAAGEGIRTESPWSGW